MRHPGCDFVCSRGIWIAVTMSLILCALHISCLGLSLLIIIQIERDPSYLTVNKFITPRSGTIAPMFSFDGPGLSDIPHKLHELLARE
jgi:hypothetical protein